MDTMSLIALAKLKDKADNIEVNNGQSATGKAETIKIGNINYSVGGGNFANASIVPNGDGTFTLKIVSS